MSDCRFGVSPVNYPNPDPDPDVQDSIFMYINSLLGDFESSIFALS